MKYSTIEVIHEDEELYNQITPKAENHCTTRSALLLKYVYRHITRMQRHPQVKRAYQDQEPTNENHCTLQSAFTVETFRFQRSTGTAETTKRRYEMKDMRSKISDERYGMNCVQAVQKLPSRTLGPAELKQWCTRQRSGRPRSVFRNPCTGEG